MHHASQWAKRALTASICLGFGLVARAADEVSGPHPDAPPETAQFAFLVGRWDCTTRSMKPEGSGYTSGRAVWQGRWILGGWAIQDDWESRGADGSRFYGTNIRSFDRKIGAWENRWLPSGSLQWSRFEARRVGDTMVMIGGGGLDPRGRAFTDRNTFYEIRPDSWRWRKDRSFDGGKTWVEGVAWIEATRAASGGGTRP